MPQILRADSNQITVGTGVTKKTYGPPVVALLGQATARMKQVGDSEILDSKSGLYEGQASLQFASPNPLINAPPVRFGSAFAEVDNAAGRVPPGAAAGAVYDPFTVTGGSSYEYGPNIDATLQVTDSSVFGGVEFYALDSFVFTTDVVDNFVEDGSPFEHTLWTLSLTANGPLGGTSVVQVDFELNPDALREIFLPSSYLASLPGYSASLSDAEIAQLVDAAIASTIGMALTLDSGVVSLQGFALFPAGTMFQPTGGDVVYGAGANAVLSAAPEPATLLLIGAGLLGLAGVSSKRRNA